MDKRLNSYAFFHDCLSQITHLYDEAEGRCLIYRLFEEYLNLRKTDIALKVGIALSERRYHLVSSGIKRLSVGEPLQYILGFTYFMSEKIEVNQSVLIPRPETEELVRIIAHEQTAKEVLDIGTGSGCIALGLKKLRPDMNIEAWDVSGEAISTAERNARNHGAEVIFKTQDVYLPWPGKKWDMIVSNPPYIPESEKERMHVNVIDFEPHSALFVPDTHPLLFYNQILTESKQHLNTDGKVFFEINENLGREVINAFEQHQFSDITLTKDCHGKDRIVSGRLSR